MHLHYSTSIMWLSFHSTALLQLLFLFQPVTDHDQTVVNIITGGISALWCHIHLLLGWLAVVYNYIIYVGGLKVDLHAFSLV